MGYVQFEYMPIFTNEKKEYAGISGEGGIFFFNSITSLDCCR
jgi:hypothetical protein